MNSDDVFFVVVCTVGCIANIVDERVHGEIVMAGPKYAGKDDFVNTVKPGVSKLFLVNNLALVNIFCFPKSHFQHKSPKDSKQPGVSKLFAAYIKVY